MKKLHLPRVSERIRGFTLPVGRQMMVFDYDEVFRLTLEDPVTVEVLPDSPSDFEEMTPAYFGVSDQEPIKAAGGAKVSYVFDPCAPSVNVTVETSTTQQHIDFPTLSGDWFVATLSATGEFLTIAEPYRLEVYRL